MSSQGQGLSPDIIVVSNLLTVMVPTKELILII